MKTKLVEFKPVPCIAIRETNGHDACGPRWCTHQSNSYRGCFSNVAANRCRSASTTKKVSIGVGCGENMCDFTCRGRRRLTDKKRRGRCEYRAERYCLFLSSQQVQTTHRGQQRQLSVMKTCRSEISHSGFIMQLNIALSGCCKSPSIEL